MVRKPTDRGLDENDRRLLHDVEETGWHVVTVPEEAGTPGWAFSVGLFHTFRHPEVIVFGLPSEMLGRIVHLIGEKVKVGKDFSAGRKYGGILEGTRCTFRPVTRRWYRPFLGYAKWFYRGPEFPVLQCLWPDKEEHYPWDPGFKKAWLPAQPLLYEGEPDTARTVELLKTLGGE